MEYHTASAFHPHWRTRLGRRARPNRAAQSIRGSNRHRPMAVIDELYQEDRLPTPPPHPRILALANQKGGVGKTTTAINLGTALAAVGERVLLIDSDPQGNASTGLGLPHALRKHTLYDVLMGEKTVLEAVVKTSVPGLHIAPSDPDLSGIEMELAQQPR